MYSPTDVVVSHTNVSSTKQENMPPKSKKKGTPARSRRTKKAANAAKRQPATPFADTGGIVGEALFGKVGKNVGKWLGSGIGTIFGSGQYTMPKYNVLTNDAQIPQFLSDGRAHVICHREFLGDVVGSVGFVNTQYPINPGLVASFPWLAALAGSYEEYKVHGLIYEFRSTSSEYNNASATLGTVVMATQYDNLDPAFTSKIAMENYEYAQSSKPSVSLIHGVECATSTNVLNRQYIRTGPVPTGADPRFYDMGTFNIATVGMSSSYVIGELWTSFCVELIKPKLASTVGGGIATGHGYLLGTTLANPLGTVATLSGSITLGVTGGNTGTFQGIASVRYLVNVVWVGTATTTASVAFTSSSSNLTPLTYFSGGTTNFQRAGDVATGATLSLQRIFACTSSGPCSFTLTGTPPTSSNADLIVTAIDSSAT